ncbi:Mediator of RNA polymerase II transcription subunit 33A [Platanthera zijinensis]|uniref:Mediator of RNA polymerase II transcription subunit 33A n=1 Tax=Platanthera zijinensis TaxID=2320716 RepID=A0AAP0BZG5_9ASPA
MPLCEAFGSFPPLPNHRPSPFDETSIYSVFSCAFLFLLRLWKFYKPPQEHRIAGRGGAVRLELTLDYLLLMHNHCISIQDPSPKDKPDYSSTSSDQPVYINSFPKLRNWYLQNQACIASTLPGLSSKNPVHQVANKILNMICVQMSKVGNLSSNPSSTSSSSMTESPVEDAFQRPLLPAWDILEAVPFVLEAVLTACASGRISSRDLVTGLRDLADFLPASLATIVSYFSAEITRGIWEPVAMNGVDWPSPATNLVLIESEIREILATVGVTLPSSYGSGAVPMLPLPMAALVSLTITFKLDKSLEYIHAVIGQALENCSTGSPWPSMSIIGALWAQKVRRWHDFIVLTGTRSPFARDKAAVAQLIRSCFSSFLGADAAHCGISGLLGHSISNQGSRLPVAPGYLYLRSCRSFHDAHFVNTVVLNLIIEHTRAAVVGQSRSRLLSSRSSLAAAASVVRHVASLGTSMLCVAGGPLLVQVLYEETLPSMLLSAAEAGPGGAATRLLEGYAMAYFLVLSGAFIWGAGKATPGLKAFFSSRHGRAVGIHFEFVAGVVDGKVSVGCDAATWRAYASCLVGLMVRYAPTWIPAIGKGTLRKLAAGLRGWQEWDLALALLERGGLGSVELVVESLRYILLLRSFHQTNVEVVQVSTNSRPPCYFTSFGSDVCSKEAMACGGNWFRRVRKIRSLP